MTIEFIGVSDTWHELPPSDPRYTGPDEWSWYALDLPITIPTGTSEGDLMLLYVAGPGALASTIPDGWTGWNIVVPPTYSDEFGSCTHYVAYKFAGPSEANFNILSATPDINGYITGAVLTYRNVANVHSYSNGYTNIETMDIDAIETNGVNNVVVYFVTADNLYSWHDIDGTEYKFWQAGGGGYNIGEEITDELYLEGGYSSPKTFTTFPDFYKAYTNVALVPVPDGPTPTVYYENLDATVTSGASLSINVVPAPIVPPEPIEPKTTIIPSTSAVLFVQNQSYGYVYAPQYDNGVWPDGILGGKSGLIQLTNDYIIQVTVTTGGHDYINPQFIVGIPWEASTAFVAKQQYVSGENLYTVLTGGTSGTTAPTTTDPTPFTDGTCSVQYAGKAAVLQCYPTSGGIVDVKIISGGSGYTRTPSVTIKDDPGGGTGATVSVLLNNFPTGPLVPGAVFLDSYVIVGTASGRIYSSGVNMPYSWNALDYLTTEAEPDSLVGIAKHLNYVVGFGQWSTEFFFDAANTVGSPLSPAQNYKSEIGCANGNSIVSFEQTVAWIGRSKATGPAAYILDGVSPIKVSTPYIERILSNSSLSDVRAYAFKFNGHMFYVLTIHDLNITIVYDMNEKTWYNWTMWADGEDGFITPGIDKEQYFRPSFYSGAYSQYFVLDDDNGKVYDISDQHYSDDGAPIYYRAVTDILDSGTTKRKFYNRVEIIGDKVPATMMVRHSGDDYKTWSSYRSVDLSKGRAQIYQTGADRRRAWEFLCTDNVPLRLDAAEVDFTIGELEQDGVPPTQYRK